MKTRFTELKELVWFIVDVEKQSIDVNVLFN